MVRMCRNQWKPDTCGCVVEFEFDADLPGETRKHKLVVVKTACPAHSDLSTHINKVLEDNVIHFHKENQRKNLALDTLATELGIPSDNTRWEKLQAYLDRWYYDTATPRVLHIVAKGLTTQQKNRAQSAANSAFGVGLIVIE